VALGAAVAGCGGATVGGPGSSGTSSGSAAPGPGSSAPVACRTPAATPSGSTHVVRVTGADSGAALCVSQGQLLEVDLAGSAATPWSISAQGSSLRETSSGSGGRPGAAPSAVFEAVAPGTAHILGTRRACAPRPSAPACAALQAYSVIVVVR
jgi:hypothetical protein